MSSSAKSFKRALESDSQSQTHKECECVEPKISCMIPSAPETPASTSDEGVSFIKDNAERVIIDLTGSDANSDEEEQNGSEQATSAADIAEHYLCSSINTNENRHLFIKNFSVKRFLVHHDYILFPYCLTNDEGRREKPSRTLVSNIIESQRGNKSYEEVVEILKIYDTLLNTDTSSRTGVKSLICDLFTLNKKSFRSKEKVCSDFMHALTDLLCAFETHTDHESEYRNVLATFLRIISSRLTDVLIVEEPKVVENTISFPILNKCTVVSGKPNIVIRNYDGYRSSALAVIECKKYKEMRVTFENTEIKDDHDLQKIIPKVRFCRVVKTSCDEVAMQERILERMYKDLDASICRPLEREEENYFGCFFAQLVGEVLASFNTCNDITVLVPFQTAQEKSVRYAIGQLGFKIIFITVGMNNSYMKSLPHIRIGESKGMGLDVFMTRPFDLMIADDRGKIRDILFAMMVMARR